MRLAWSPANCESAWSIFSTFLPATSRPSTVVAAIAAEAMAAAAAAELMVGGGGGGEVWGGSNGQSKF